MIWNKIVCHLSCSWSYSKTWFLLLWLLSLLTISEQQPEPMPQPDHQLDSYKQIITTTANSIGYLFTFDNVCVSHEDCRLTPSTSNETSSSIITNETETTNFDLLPLFCMDDYVCLCNHLQSFTYPVEHPTSYEIDQHFDECTKCHFRILKTDDGELIDPCHEQDPYSFCNQTTGHCECMGQMSIDCGNQTKTDEMAHQQSVCKYHLMNEEIERFINSTNQMIPWKESVTGINYMLATLFSYIFPFTMIAIFVYFMYTSMFQNRRNQESEMILYQAL